MSRSRWDDAGKSFTEARDTGTPDVIAGRRVRSRRDRLRQERRARLQEARAGRAQAACRRVRGARSQGGALLYVLTGISVAEKGWPGRARLRAPPGRRPTRRTKPPTTGSSASQPARRRRRRGPLPSRPTCSCARRYPRSPFAEAGRVRVAEALLETGKADEGAPRGRSGAGGGRRTTRGPRCCSARMRAAGGDRSGALEDYARAARVGQGLQGSRPALLESTAACLVEDRQWSQARGVFEGCSRATTPRPWPRPPAASGDACAGEGGPVRGAPSTI